MAAAAIDKNIANVGGDDQVYLTLTVAGQTCGVPVLSVRDVLGPQSITRIPLAPPEVAGSLNLRGRIVTAVDLRLRLGLPDRDVSSKPMSVVVELGTELYSLLADAVGEVVPLDRSKIDANPQTLDPLWRDVSAGIFRGDDGKLLVILDVEHILDLSGK